MLRLLLLRSAMDIKISLETSWPAVDLREDLVLHLLHQSLLSLKDSQLIWAKDLQFRPNPRLLEITHSPLLLMVSKNVLSICSF
jgi:hypothetical protein